MSEATQQLVDLQDTDRRIRKLQQIIDSVPQEKAKIEEELSGTEAVVEEAKHRSQEMEMRVKSLEIDIGVIQQKMNHFLGQTAAVKKNDEYKALLSEIENCKVQISDLEDQELELWEEREGTSAVMTDASEQLKAARKRIASALDDLDVRERNASSQLEKLREKRGAQVSSIDAVVLEPYERLTEIARRRGQNKDCLVPLNGNSCGGCHMSSTTQTQAHVRGGKIVPCEKGGSLIYVARGE
jgi:predicted  nucleic acid-binding Zn-ribbon protein